MGELFHGQRGYSLGFFKGHAADDALVILGDRQATAVVILKAFATDGDDLNRFAQQLFLGHETIKRTQQVGIESGAQAAVAGDQDDQGRVLLGRGVEQRVGIGLDATREVVDDFFHLRGVGFCRVHRVLSPPQLCRGHKLHGAGDLLGVFHRGDAVSNVLEVGQTVTLLCGFKDEGMEAERASRALAKPLEKGPSGRAHSAAAARCFAKKLSVYSPRISRASFVTSEALSLEGSVAFPNFLSAAILSQIWGSLLSAKG